MRVIGLMASHCTELRDDIPVTEVRLVSLKMDVLTLKQAFLKIPRNASRCHCSISVFAYSQLPLRGENTKQK